MSALIEGVQSAIEDLRPSFQADDFNIPLERLSDDGAVIVAIEAGSAACLDCLMPEPMLTRVVDAAVRRFAPDVTSVTVVKRGFEAPGSG